MKDANSSLISRFPIQNVGFDEEGMKLPRDLGWSSVM
jgi:hypothetical protein